MSSGKDYIPRPDGIFNGWANKLADLVNRNVATWNINDAEVNELNTLLATWNDAFASGGKMLKSTRTSELVNKKTTARKELVKFIRVFVKRWFILNPALTDANRISLQVSVKKKNYAREHKPTTIPFVEIFTKKGAVIEFNFKQIANEAGVSHRGKPVHTHGMKIYYKIDDPAPASFKDCNNSITITKSPYLLEMDHEDIYKKIYCYCCWVNYRQQEGPMTPMYTTMVTV